MELGGVSNPDIFSLMDLDDSRQQLLQPTSSSRPDTFVETSPVHEHSENRELVTLPMMTDGFDDFQSQEFMSTAALHNNIYFNPQFVNPGFDHSQPMPPAVDLLSFSYDTLAGINRMPGKSLVSGADFLSPFVWDNAPVPFDCAGSIRDCGVTEMPLTVDAWPWPGLSCVADVNLLQQNDFSAEEENAHCLSAEHIASLAEECSSEGILRIAAGVQKGIELAETSCNIARVPTSACQLDNAREPRTKFGPSRPVLLSPARRGGRKRPLSAEEKKRRKESRKHGICIRCRNMKTRVSSHIHVKASLVYGYKLTHSSATAVSLAFHAMKDRKLLSGHIHVLEPAFSTLWNLALISWVCTHFLDVNASIQDKLMMGFYI
jgi:hypothetical protein